MKCKRNLVFATLIVIFTGICVRASCGSDPSPPCQAFWTAEVVFTGTVTQVSHSATYEKGEGADKWHYQDRITRFTPDEVFRGTIGKQVDVVASVTMPTPIILPDGSPGSKSTSGDCEYKFNQGERYIVYARFRKTNDGTLWVGYNRTRPLAQADDDLRFIRGLSQAPPRVGFLFGFAKRYEQELKSGGSPRNVSPIANARIVIEGAQQKRETYTDSEGKYSISDLPAGDYEVKAVFPDHLTSYPAQKARILERGCAEINFFTQTDGRISGTVFDAQGQPLPKMRLDLALADQDQNERNPQVLSAYADDEGRYEFRSVPAGRYHLGVRLTSVRDADFPFPRAYFPGVSKPEDAKVFTLKEGEKIPNIDFVMPPRLESRTIEGIVVWPDGRPFAGAWVTMMIAEYPFSFAQGGSGTTDDAGRFSIKGFNGLSYWINAVVNLRQGQMHAEPVDLPAHGDVKDVKLVITSPSGNCERCRHRYWPKRKS